MAYNKNAQVNRKIFLDDIENVVLKYNNGQSMKMIAKDYSVSYQFVSSTLIDLGVKKKGRRIYNINESYFDEINTPNKAYIFGLLCADGTNHIKDSNGKNHPNVMLGLQSRDRTILEAIRKEMNSEAPIREVKSKRNSYIYGRKINASNIQNQCVFEFHSLHLSKMLEIHGMIQNKTMILEFPDIPKDLYSHFIRGYFDGNGSICKFHDKRNNSYRNSFSITSTIMFCEKVKQIMEQTLNVKLTMCLCHPKENKITTKLSTMNWDSVRIIMDWLYKDADMFLQRKYDKYAELYNINDSLIV